jgi:hypothetical protein
MLSLVVQQFSYRPSRPEAGLLHGVFALDAAAQRVRSCRPPPCRQRTDRCAACCTRPCCAHARGLCLGRALAAIARGAALKRAAQAHGVGGVLRYLERRAATTVPSANISACELLMRFFPR